MLDLQALKKKMEIVKTDISVQEGQRIAAVNDLKTNYGIDNLDKAYDKLDELQAQIDSTKTKREELAITVETQLKQYGY